MAKHLQTGTELDPNATPSAMIYLDPSQLMYKRGNLLWYNAKKTPSSDNTSQVAAVHNETAVF